METHPHLDVKNGIHATTGSMGHGFPYAVGIAMAKKMQNKTGRVFVLLGDGECQEGTFWESLLIVKQHSLRNLHVIVDMNGIQGSDFTKNILPMKSLSQVVNAMELTCKEIYGHSIESIRSAYDVNPPTFLIAQTTKGAGCSFMEDDPAWHSKRLTPELYQQALNELK